MKTFLAGVICGAVFAAGVLGFTAGGELVRANQVDAKAVKFVGISNATDKSNTRAIAENGDVYELKRRSVKGDDGKTVTALYWAKEVNIVADEAEYTAKKP
jgi:hypothetical protein